MKAQLSASDLFEASCTRVYLPGCANCGDRHPLAYQPPRDVPDCPTCGAAVEDPPPPERSPAVITGRSPGIRLARALLWAAAKLNRFATRK